MTNTPNIPLKSLIAELKSKGRFWIVFTGDSITSCEWVHPNWRDIVIYVLQSEVTRITGDWKLASWGIRGFNFAFDGGTTKDIVNKMPDILALKPDLLIGLMGGNDPALGVSVDESVSNISQIHSMSVTQLTKVIWCTSTSALKGNGKNAEYAPYAKAVMSLPQTDQIQMIDVFSEFQHFPTERFFTFISEENLLEGIHEGDIDPQHPNQLGNAYIAKIILDRAFDINFDPEKYIRETRDGLKYPGY